VGAPSFHPRPYAELPHASGEKFALFAAALRYELNASVGVPASASPAKGAHIREISDPKSVISLAGGQSLKLRETVSNRDFTHSDLVRSPNATATSGKTRSRSLLAVDKCDPASFVLVASAAGRNRRCFKLLVEVSRPKVEICTAHGDATLPVCPI
jgi:hypothetical protein